ncbi:MAG: hypothetical protein KDD82_14480 [Planctomycetes bacterium]|nr:hypothetical protein [Planctomycetota bacterium]
MDSEIQELRRALAAQPTDEVVAELARALARQDEEREAYSLLVEHGALRRQDPYALELGRKLFNSDYFAFAHSKGFGAATRFASDRDEQGNWTWLAEYLTKEAELPVLAIRVDKKLSKNLMKQWDGFSCLEYLNLSSVRVSDDELRRVPLTPSLQRLYLSGGKLSGEGIGSFARLKALRELDISGSPTAAPSAETWQQLAAALAPLPALRTLRLTFAPLDDRGLEHLCELSGLEQLSVNNTSVGDEGLLALARLDRLRTLNLYRCEGVSDAGLEVLDRLPDLEDLDLGSTGITDAGLARVARLPRLRRLNLSYCKSVTLNGIRELAGLSTLRDLTVHSVGFDEAEVSAALPQVTTLKV